MRGVVCEGGKQQLLRGCECGDFFASSYCVLHSMMYTQAILIVIMIIIIFFFLCFLCFFFFFPFSYSSLRFSFFVVVFLSEQKKKKISLDCVLHERAVGLEWFMLFFFMLLFMLNVCVCVWWKNLWHFHAKHCVVEKNNKLNFAEVRWKIKKRERERVGVGGSYHPWHPPLRKFLFSFHFLRLCFFIFNLFFLRHRGYAFLCFSVCVCVCECGYGWI